MCSRLQRLRQTSQAWLAIISRFLFKYVLIRSTLTAYLSLLLVFSLYLYHYAAFCPTTPGWTWPTAEVLDCPSSGTKERWVFFADPQIEGQARVNEQGVFGELDLLVNDWYMRHVVDNLHRFAKPDIVITLGDLISHFKLVDSEFARRVTRIRQIFQTTDADVDVHSELLSYAEANQENAAVEADNNSSNNKEEDNVDRAATDDNNKNNNNNNNDGENEETDGEQKEKSLNVVNVEPQVGQCHPFCFEDVAVLEKDERGQPPIVWLVGNHDIGYGKAITRQALGRWERTFGPTNTVFRTKTNHLLVVTNSQTMEDFSTQEARLHTQTKEFLESVMHDLPSEPIVLLKHIPLHKPKGMCHDEPLIKREQRGIVKQNMMSPEVTEWLLQGLRPVLVFDGHDHEGCVFYHTAEGRTIPEFTVRSMMGVFSGHSLIVDVCDSKSTDSPRYHYSIRECPFISIRFVVLLIVSWLVGLATMLAVLLMPWLAHLPIFYNDSA